MATSSIRKEFVIKDEAIAKRFLKDIDAPSDNKQIRRKSNSVEKGDELLKRYFNL